MMGECINPALHARVVIERVAIEITELRGVPLHGGALEGYGNVGFDKGSVLDGDKALKTLHKEDNILIVNVLSYQDYLTFSMCPIKVGVNVSQVGLIPSFCYGLW